MKKIKSMVVALQAETPPELLRRRSSSKSHAGSTPRRSGKSPRSTPKKDGSRPTSQKQSPEIGKGSSGDLGNAEKTEEDVGASTLARYHQFLTQWRSYTSIELYIS